MDKIDELLERRVDKIYPSKKALEKVLRSGKKLKLYQGFDPSSPNLHIGHLVGLLKLREFQELGHEVIFLIGDFTGMIGDPTGKIKSARPQLTHEKVLENAKTYKKQAAMILDFNGSNAAQCKYNGEWLSKLSAIDAFRLMRFLTLPQIIKRGMFQKRMKAGEDLFASELMYPFLQAYDSLAMDVDLEIGGSDQMFNMLVGRDLMKRVKGKEKFVVTTKILADSQGKKIGKTEGNAINLINKPEVFFGQIMGLTDDCIIPCLELITDMPLTEIKKTKEALKSGENPMKFKKQLAQILVNMIHDQKTAQTAQKHFEKVFQNQEKPEQIKEVKVKSKNIVDVLVETKLASSRGEAKRLINQNAVKQNDQIIKNLNTPVKSGATINVGKRKWVKIK